MPKIGRPTVLTKATEAKIAQCFFDGFTDEETAIYCEISKRTIQRARNSAEGFCLRIKKAEIAMRAECLARIRSGSGSNWQGMAWFLERRWPLVYSRPEIQLQVNNTIGPQTTNVVILSPKAAKVLDSRSQTIEAKVTKMLAETNGESSPE